MKNTLSYKGYSGSVECSEEDQVFFGKVLFIKSLLMYEGETFKELSERFHEVIDEYLADCEEEGVKPEKPCSGTLNVRIGQERHLRLAEYAVGNGTSINAALCATIDEFFSKPTNRAVV